MHRLRCLVVIGTLAVAVWVVAASPALAAKGGNSDNAHACQQGGFQNLFDTGSGRAFKNAGDCASHGARGGDTSSLDIQSRHYTCPPPNNGSGQQCWGTVVGSGLAAGAMVTVTVDGESVSLVPPVTVGQNNTVNSSLNLPCDLWLGGFVLATAQTTAGGTITGGGETVVC
jgi:hypothetical protein